MPRPVPSLPYFVSSRLYRPVPLQTTQSTPTYLTLFRLIQSHPIIDAQFGEQLDRECGRCGIAAQRMAQQARPNRSGTAQHSTARHNSSGTAQHSTAQHSMSGDATGLRVARPAPYPKYTRDLSGGCSRQGRDVRLERTIPQQQQDRRRCNGCDLRGVWRRSASRPVSQPVQQPPKSSK